MLKAAEIRNLNAEEIDEKVKGLKQDLMRKRFESKTGKLENRSVMKGIKRDIARLLTIKNQKKAEAKS